MTGRTSELPHDEPDEAPEGFREQPRYAPAVERAYANDRIEVTWEPAFCIHAAECLRGLPAVFDNHSVPPSARQRGQEVVGQVGQLGRVQGVRG
jgi:uncharacterized Fe-S cluster protein YjdI